MAYNYVYTLEKASTDPAALVSVEVLGLFDSEPAARAFVRTLTISDQERLYLRKAVVWPA